MLFCAMFHIVLQEAQDTRSFGEGGAFRLEGLWARPPPVKQIIQRGGACQLKGVSGPTAPVKQIIRRRGAPFGLRAFRQARTL